MYFLSLSLLELIVCIYEIALFLLHEEKRFLMFWKAQKRKEYLLICRKNINKINWPNYMYIYINHFISFFYNGIKCKLYKILSLTYIIDLSLAISLSFYIIIFSLRYDKKKWKNFVYFRDTNNIIILLLIVIYIFSEAASNEQQQRQQK